MRFVPLREYKQLVLMRTKESNMLRFNDGMSFITDVKPARPIKKSDGWYCVGYGMLIPCNDLEEAKTEAEKINQLHNKEKASGN